MTHRQQSNLISALVLGVAAFFFYCSFEIRTDAVYPRVLCIAIAVLSLITIIQTVAESRREAKHPQHKLEKEEMTTEELAEQMAKEAEEKVRWQDILAVTVIAFVSLILWEYVSFLFAGMLGILALSLYKKQPIIRSVLIAVITALAIQFIFRNIFTIPLPSPSWWPYF